MGLSNMTFRDLCNACFNCKIYINSTHYGINNTLSPKDWLTSLIAERILDKKVLTIEPIGDMTLKVVIGC